MTKKKKKAPIKNRTNDEIHEAIEACERIGNTKCVYYKHLKEALVERIGFFHDDDDEGLKE
ncbi:MAG: hypothetical protein KAS32_09225 [Candidatus Peribacteraceae bacterium]|nr:hypothetical protein [Candidatus Peribacteraceae bacterium]